MSSNFGFALKKLQILGTGVEPAEIIFRRGPNIISGLSDTGKSYILQCIDFMLGAKAPPKEIDESKPYNKLLLEIESYAGATYTLERNLQGGAFNLYEVAINQLKPDSAAKILKPQHDAKKDDNISTFILSLCGMSGVKIRKNIKNETLALSFRTISHLFLINETQIIEETSPIEPKNVYEKSKLEAAFKFLLTGKDDRELIAEQDDDNQRLLLVKQEIYDQLISDLERKIASLEENGSIPQEIERLKANINEVSTSITESSNEISERQQIRQQAWEELQEANSRLIVISELLKRFDLLRQHYQSDLKRLEFISEGDYLFEQLEPVNCPLCGQPVADHEAKQMCINSRGEIIDIQTACREETIKITAHLRDLEGTVQTLIVEQEEMSTRSQNNNVKLHQSSRYIADILKPKQIAEEAELKRLEAAYRSLAELEVNIQRLEELREVRNSLGSVETTTKTDKISRSLDKTAVRSFCDVVKDTLVSWNYPDVQVVEFDESKMDIVISGRPRRSHGKGIRALTYSAFTIGLMRYCKLNNLPHTNMIVLDSPLTTFKEKTRDSVNEDVSGVIHAAFFDDLALTPNDEQIIILENKIPSPEIISKVNFIEFVGRTGSGRKGFFPI